MTKNKINQNRTIHILFGKTAIGTAASAYYLSENYEKIYKKFKDKDYFIMIKGNPSHGYKSFNGEFIDRTKLVL